MDIFITGIGWVNKISMGYQGNIKVFDFSKALPAITRQDVLKEPYKPFGRMDDYSKIGFAAIVFAVRDAYAHGTPPENTCIVASTANGCLKTDMKYQNTIDDPNVLPSPTLFAYTLPSCFLGEVSILYGLTGESLVINEKNTSGIKGLGIAVDLLFSDQTNTVLCGINNADIQNIAESSDSTPGAFFCLLETYRRKNATVYGILKRDGSQNRFFYNHTPISSLYDLVEISSKIKE